MNEEALRFVHGLRSARHITVVTLAGQLGLTKGQYYYRLRKGDNIDPRKMFDAVIEIDAKANRMTLYPEQIDAFRRRMERLCA